MACKYLCRLPTIWVVFAFGGCAVLQVCDKYCGCGTLLPAALRWSWSFACRETCLVFRSHLRTRVCFGALVAYRCLCFALQLVICTHTMLRVVWMCASTLIASPLTATSTIARAPATHPHPQRRRSPVARSNAVCPSECQVSVAVAPPAQAFSCLRRFCSSPPSVRLLVMVLLVICAVADGGADGGHRMPRAQDEGKRARWLLPRPQWLLQRLQLTSVGRLLGRGVQAACAAQPPARHMW